MLLEEVFAIVLFEELAGTGGGAAAEATAGKSRVPVPTLPAVSCSCTRTETAPLEANLNRAVPINGGLFSGVVYQTEAGASAV